MWPWPNLQVQKKESNMYLRNIQRNKLPSWLHQLRSLCRDKRLWNENVPQWEEMKRSLTATDGSLRTSSGPNSFCLQTKCDFQETGTHCGETRLLVPGSDSRQIKHRLTFCRGRNLAPQWWWYCHYNLSVFFQILLVFWQVSSLLNPELISFISSSPLLLKRKMLPMPLCYTWIDGLV